MLDFDDFVKNNPAFRKFEVDTLLFMAYAMTALWKVLL